MLKIGEHAPDFSGTDQSGNNCQLSEKLAAGRVILYFYPADFTPICTAEACAFRDSFDDLESISVQIVGVSPQSADSHRRFAERFQLRFPLLSDGGKKIIRSYGVDGPMGFGVRRVTFLITPDQQIANRVVSDLFVGSHTALIRKVLANHQSPE